jgi:hypothetical protein
MTYESSDQMSPAKAGWSVGLSTTAAVFLLLGGTFQFLAGLAALIHDEFFVVGENYIYSFDVTAWGWIHLLVGIVAFIAGLGVLRVATWARVVGIIAAALGAIGNFLWLPYQPWWSILLIVLYVAVIWALASLGRAAR